MDFADFKDLFLFLIFLNDYKHCVKNKKTSLKQRYRSLSECKPKSIILYNLADNRVLLNVIGIKGRFWLIGISAVTLVDLLIIFFRTTVQETFSYNREWSFLFGYAVILVI